ncbi:MAG: hypothetical protein V4713_16035 [Pseudomonadota bacterium]
MSTTAPVIQTRPGSKDKRTRQVLTPLAQLPTLSAAQQAVLQSWLKSDTRERRWQSLLEAAGASHLETAHSLLQLLLHAGAVAIKEEFRHGAWRPWRVVWPDLEAVQRLANVSTRTERDASKESLNALLQAQAKAHPWLAPAVQSVLNDAFPATTRAARADLLLALVPWQQAQRQGLRQDFALAARGHTKAITPAEWDWLDATLTLESLGIGRFEPLLWLSGSITLRQTTEPQQQGVMALQGFGFVGLPCRQFSASLEVAMAPQSYWLIENRASFERQTSLLAAGVCLVWLPGRPSGAWLGSMRWLLAHAPAPATISCDPDPAGIQIALTAGQLWDEVGVAWQAGHMAPSDWQRGKVLPLTDYDHRVLAELQSDAALPPDLALLRDYIESSGTKAEQEGWL